MYCRKCGKEIQDGSIFCPNCGEPIDTMNKSETTFSQANNQHQEIDEKGADLSIQKYGKFFGVILLVLSVICLFTDPPLLTIVFSLVIILLSILCLVKRFRLKGFTIAALVISVFCLGAGIWQATVYGLTTIPDNGTTKEAVNVDPELKAFLDSYEEFVDEYVAFMKDYSSGNGNALTMLGDYTKLLVRLAEFADKVDDYDVDNMSEDDAKYYLEVTGRCTQKLLGVGE